MNFTPPNQIGRLAAAVLLWAIGISQAPAASTTVTVNFGASMSAMPSQGLGVASAVYDGSLLSSGVSSALVNADTKAVRYPGGSYADIFNWQTTTVNGGSYVDTSDTFDNFMNTVVSPAGARAIITVNYGSNPANNGGGDPTVAAAWVQYANRTKGYGITYWEIGNEVGGNGYYGDPGWEYDLHYPFYNGQRAGQPSLSPAAYGQNAVTFVNDMKAQDSTIKCGVGIAQPGTWPDTANPPYNQQLLANCGSVIDFVIIHWYPGGAESALLQTPLQIPGIVSSVKSELSSYTGSRAGQIQLLITETGAGSVTGQATTLFAADDFLSWLENGVANVDYQELHNGFLDNNNNLLGPAYGSKMAGILAGPGDTFVSKSSGSTLVAAHAARKSNGHYAVMLINKDPNNAYTVTVNVSGATLASSGTRYDCSSPTGVSQSSISGIGASSFSLTVAAYTVSVVDVAAGSGCTPTPITPYVQINGGAWVQTATATVNAGDTVTFGPQPVSGGSWNWTGPNGFTSTSRQVSLTSIQTSQAGTYIATYTNPGGCNSTQNFTVTVNGAGGGAIANGTYKIINRNSGQALDAAGQGTANGTQIDQWPYNSQNNQRWTVTSLGNNQYQVIGVQSGRSLDVFGSGTANGTKIELWDYSGGNNQRWTFTATSGGYYRITPANATGSCIEVAGSSTANGALVDLWTYGGGNNQQWTFQAP